MKTENKTMQSTYKEEFMTYKEAAFELGYSYGTVRVYASQGRIQVVRPKGRRPYILKSYCEEVKRHGF